MKTRDEVCSVVVSIVHASNPRLTMDCLASLHSDPDRATEAEIVVLDNASGDEASALIRERFPDVRIVEQQYRAGFGANQNTIFKASKSKYVFVLNNDTVVPPGTIDALARYLDDHPTAAVAGPLIRGFDGRQQGSAWRLMSVGVQLVWALTLGKRGAVTSRGDTSKRVGAVSACAMLVRREALSRIGLFDEEYFMFSEEADLARRLDELGLERHYVPTIEMYHLGQNSTSKTLEHQVNEYWRSQDLYLARYHSRLEARLIGWLTGVGYALATLAGAGARLLPSAALPAAVGSSDVSYYKLHVRNAFRGNRDPGLRELAEEWNQQHGVQPY